MRYLAVALGVLAVLLVGVLTLQVRRLRSRSQAPAETTPDPVATSGDAGAGQDAPGAMLRAEPDPGGPPVEQETPERERAVTRRPGDREAPGEPADPGEASGDGIPGGPVTAAPTGALPPALASEAFERALRRLMDA